jgi:protein TonB
MQDRLFWGACEMTATFHTLRTPLVLPVAGAVTVGLFLMMRQLIDIGPWQPDPVEDLPPVEIRFDVEPYDPPDPLTPDDITRVDPPPPPPRVDTPRAAVDAVQSDVSWTLPSIEPAVVSGGAGLVNIDRQPAPRVRVQPVYPAGAASRGQEGECTVVFDITPEGRTANIRAQSCTSRAFERATVNAVAGWRYDPQVRDGEAVIYRGATTQLVFTLDP